MPQILIECPETGQSIATTINASVDFFAQSKAQCEVDVADGKRYESASRVRQRIGELETDAEILKETHPDLHEELREAVCDE